jgi:hypothetical protein
LGHSHLIIFLHGRQGANRVLKHRR